MEALDYSKCENWAIFEENPTKPVDAFWVYGTMAQVSDLPNSRAFTTSRDSRS